MAKDREWLYERDISMDEDMDLTSYSLKIKTGDLIETIADNIPNEFWVKRIILGQKFLDSAESGYISLPEKVRSSNPRSRREQSGKINSVVDCFNRLADGSILRH